MAYEDRDTAHRAAQVVAHDYERTGKCPCGHDDD